MEPILTTPMTTPLVSAFDGSQTVFVLETGNHDIIFPSRAFESGPPQSTFHSRMNTMSRSVCFKCGYDQHIQNYCPLQFCTKCRRFGHHHQACVSAHNKGTLMRDTDVGPVELRSDRDPDAVIDDLTFSPPTTTPLPHTHTHNSDTLVELPKESDLDAMLARIFTKDKPPPPQAVPTRQASPPQPPPGLEHPHDTLA